MTSRSGFIWAFKIAMFAKSFLLLPSNFQQSFPRVEQIPVAVFVPRAKVAHMKTLKPGAFQRPLPSTQPKRADRREGKKAIESAG